MRSGDLCLLDEEFYPSTTERFGFIWVALHEGISPYWQMRSVATGDEALIHPAGVNEIVSTEREQGAH